MNRTIQEPNIRDRQCFAENGTGTSTLEARGPETRTNRDGATEKEPMPVRAQLAQASAQIPLAEAQLAQAQARQIRPKQIPITCSALSKPINFCFMKIYIVEDAYQTRKQIADPLAPIKDFEIVGEAESVSLGRLIFAGALLFRH
jgi:hypothetical protein